MDILLWKQDYTIFFFPFLQARLKKKLFLMAFKSV